MSEKRGFDPRLLLLFRQDELIVDKCSEEKADQIFRKCEFRSTAAVVRDRLDLMGFTIEGAISEFRTLVEDPNTAIEAASFWMGSSRAEEAQRIGTFLEKYNFKQWTSAMRYLIKQRSKSGLYRESEFPHTASVASFVSSGMYGHWGFFSDDPRYFVRSFLELVGGSVPVVLDLTDLAENEYFDPGENTHDSWFTLDAVEYSRTTPTIVLTEGSTDAWILRESLKVIYPHLVGFFSFMDFEAARPMGGASALVNVVKVFVGSGIKNRIIALFDNDTAGRSSLLQLRQLHLPKNFSACTLPDAASLKRYPTVGPHGASFEDLNGKAGGIEMYLGERVLGRGKNRIPVRWTSYDAKLDSYQGEIADKNAVHQRFKDLVKSSIEGAKVNREDWMDLRLVWNQLKDVAQSLSCDVVASALTVGNLARLD